MTNRLHILEREREQLELALADDPHWQAFCEAQRRATTTAGPAPQLSPEVLAGLTRSQPFAAYMEVVREIDRIKAATPPQPAAESQSAPAPVPETTPPPQQVDDLTAIRRIDRALEKELNGLGIFTYQTIATWDRHQVRAVRDALELGKRIWRENWIEQAALLQLRQVDRTSAQPVPIPVPVAAAEPTPPDPAPAQDVAAAIDIVGPTPAEEPRSEPPNADPTPAQPSDITPSQDALPAAATIRVGRRPPRLPAPAARRFAYLRGVSDELSEELRAAGIKSIAEIADWTRSDVRWFQAMLGDNARISRDQWIEQAALLARGRWTRHALRVVSGETRLLVPRPDPIAHPASPQPLPAPEAHRSDDASSTGPAAELTTNPTAFPEALETVVPEALLPDIEDSANDSAHAHLDAAVPPASETPPPLTIVDATEPPPLPVTEQLDEPTLPPAATTPSETQPIRNLIGGINRPPPDLGSRDQPMQPPPSTQAAPSPQPLEPPPVRPTAATAQFTSLQRPPPPSTEANLQAPTVAPRLPVMPNVGAEDDRADAEALVIKRSGPSDLQASFKEDEPLAPAAAEPGPAVAGAPAKPQEPELEDLPDAPVWGDEADVVIVTREGARREPEVPTQQPAPARAEQAPDPLPQQRRPNVRLFDEDRQNEASVPYGNAIEEASVTIIRAESSQEDAASVVPNDIANDADAPQPPKQNGGARTLGSRFLKALTGK